MATTTSAVLEAPYRIALRSFPLPEIGPEDALMRVEAAGVCGTDPKVFHGKIPKYQTYPIILGHEMVGPIVEIGSEAAARHGVKKGDRVVAEATMPCRHCHQCLAGRYRFCPSGVSYGLGALASNPPYLWGSYGQHMYIPPNAILHKISSQIPAESAVLANAVVSNGIQWVRKIGQAMVGETIVVQGVGPIGLACVVAARESGANPVIAVGLSRDRQRMEMAREYGAHYCIDAEKEDPLARVRDITGGRMADLVVDVTGSGQSIARSVDMVRAQGRIICGGLTAGDQATPIITDRLVLREIRFQGVFSKDSDAVIDAIQLLESRKYPFERMVTHRYPLAEAEQALKAAAGELESEYPIKTIIVP